MVQYGRLPSRPKLVEPQYDPYALVQLIVNDLPVLGRPVEFNTDPVNANTVLDLSGQPIYPVSCVAQCPQCGDGITVPLSRPSFGPHRLDCLDVIECRLRTRKIVTISMPDPFLNPFLEGMMAVGDIDVTLVSVLEVTVSAAGTVADRLGILPPVGDEP